MAQHIKERYKAVLDEASTSEYARTARVGVYLIVCLITGCVIGTCQQGYGY